MADHERTSWRAFVEGLGPAPAPTLPADDFAMASLERHKHEGMILAVQARFFVLGVIAIMLPIVNFQWEMIYYEILLVGFMLNGWAQMKVATVGQSRTEIFVLFVDLALMAIVVMVPNALAPVDWPLEMQFRFHAHQYFYVFLAFGTLVYS